MLTASTLRSYERVLDMRTGILERTVTFRTARGAIVSVRSRRLASLHWRHLAAISYEVTLISGPADLAISSEFVGHPPLRRRVARSARRHPHGRVGARADRHSCEGDARPARAAHPREPDRPRLRNGPPDRDRPALHGRVERRAPRGPRRLLPRRRAGDPGPRHEAAQLPPRRADAGRRSPAPRQPHARPGGRRRVRADRGRPARAARRVLGEQRHRDRRARRRPAGRPLQPLPGPPGLGPGRGPRDRREGPDRPRVRGPVLLGHRDLRDAGA